MNKAICCLIISIIPLAIQAQMFSYGEVKEPSAASTTYIYIGSPNHSFNYTGGTPVFTSAEQLEFNNRGFAFLLESPSFMISANLANRLTGLEDRSYSNLNINYYNALRLYRNSRLKFELPILLASSLVNVSNENNREDFNQIELSLNPGLLFKVKLLPRLEWSNQSTYGYGFSSSNGGFFGGTVTTLNFASRLNLLQLFGNRSLSIGYNYIDKSFNIEGEDFDYDLSGHTILIGMSL